jgi:phosphoribosyl 1,2-cyclic phosphodiesterase
MLFITSLNSGSNGNCYYIGNDREAVLVDAGISCREIEKRMSNLQLPLARVKALFISHEHSDHINGVSLLSRKYKIPVYITPPTLKHAGIFIPKELQHSFTDNETITIGEIRVIPFAKHHDASDPYSFMVEYSDIRVSVITDIGRTCDRVIHYFSQSHACFLESNYDHDMLERGGYPIFLKNRIRGGKGHISNAEALELFRNHRPPFMSHLLLSHLSKNNNDPQLVMDLFSQHAHNINIVVASRYKESEVFTVTSNPGMPPLSFSLKQENVQLALFSQDPI